MPDDWDKVVCFRCATQGYNRCQCNSRSIYVEVKIEQIHPPIGATLNEEIKKLENEIEGLFEFYSSVVEYLMKKV